MTHAPRPLKLRLFADHGQIHLLDESSSPAFEDAWTVQATDDRIAVAEGGLAIGTADTYDVTVTVERLPGPPAHDDEGVDHGTEASVSVPSGKLVIMGCTDSFPEAKRLDVGAGTYRVRVDHSGLAKRKERIAVHLWAAPMADPRVRKRWEPPPAKVRPSWGARPPRTARKAAECVRAGHLAIALPVLEKLANAGSVEASLSLAQICAFRRDDDGLVQRATALFDHPSTFGACNPLLEMGQLAGGAVRRIAARDRAEPQAALAEALRVLEGLASKTPDVAGFRKALFEGGDDGSEYVGEVEPAKLAEYELWLARARSDKTFRGRPIDLLQHAFKVARNKCLEDEVLRLWADPALPRSFAEAVCVARWHAFRGRQDEAWSAVEPNFRSWWPVFYYQVAPVELLLDRWLEPLLTPERCERILVTPRGGEAS
jgi:hypothetical protein